MPHDSPSQHAPASGEPQPTLGEPTLGEPGSDALTQASAKAALWVRRVGLLATGVFGLLALGSLSVALGGQPVEVPVSGGPPVAVNVWMIFAMLMALGVVPGVVYLLLVPLVRRARPFAVNLALLIGMTQGVVVGIQGLAGVLQSLVQADPIALTMAVVLFGTPFALLVHMSRQLLATRLAKRDVDDLRTDPWDHAP